jgi:pimeloyl-ACP methyl ester carboxylesterase
LLPGYVDVVRTVLDAEGIQGNVALMGNSMGAVVSLLFAARHPHRTDRVVLIDMPALRSVPRLWRVAMSRPAELALRTGLRALPTGAAQYGLGVFYTHFAAWRLTPARVVKRLAGPGGAVVLPGCGHCPQVEHPAELLSEVAPFLQGAARPVDATARTA